MSSPAARPETSQTATRPALLAFTGDAESASHLKAFALKLGLEGSAVQTGDIDAAALYLKTHPSPQVLCVDIASAEAAPAALDRLADVCDPTVKVIVSGKVNEYSFYRWLKEMGIAHYLLKPFTPAALEAAYREVTEVKPAAAAALPEVKKDGKVISVIGARGGVGATTVAVNMAWILANQLGQKTAILDFDPQLGTVALALDLEPGRGLREALEKPERIDGLFLDRVMVRLDDKLSVLSTEEGLEENISASGAAAEALFKQTRPKFSHIIVDLPRQLSPYTRHALKHSDHIVCVTELTLLGLREALRYLEYCRDVLKAPTPLFVANRSGLAGKHQMPQSEFEKGLGAKIGWSVPFSLDAHAASTSGELLVETARNTPATKVLQSLTAQFVGGTEALESASKKGLFGFLKNGK